MKLSDVSRSWPRAAMHAIGTGLASLRFRLVVIPAMALLVASAAAMAIAIHGARARIQAEVDSGMRLGRGLVEAALLDIEEAPRPEAALERLARSLPGSRHVDLVVVPADGPVPAAPAVAHRAERAAVPAWFSRIVNPAPVAETIPVAVHGRQYGRILISANPWDEILEVWDEFKSFSELYAGLSLVIIGLIFWTVGVALRPVRLLADGLDRLERGQFDAAVEPIRLAELRRIGERFNSLARSLRQVTADNRLLIETLISVQERERKELAHELHDELGACLFGIRADALCIVKAAESGAPSPTEISERARSIAGLADDIRRINRRMLERLRPVVLDQMGLGDALRQLVMSWRERHPEIGWALHLPDRPLAVGEAIGVAVYRAVQECLTNVVRHAAARDVVVRIDDARLESPQGGILDILVRDDGKGLPADLRFGFGLLGMSERVRGLGGQVKLSNAPERGAMVEIALPLEPARMAS